MNNKTTSKTKKWRWVVVTRRVSFIGCVVLLLSISTLIGIIPWQQYYSVSLTKSPNIYSLFQNNETKQQQEQEQHGGVLEKNHHDLSFNTETVVNTVAAATNTTIFDYSNFWKQVWNIAFANNESLIHWEKEEEKDMIHRQQQQQQQSEQYHYQNHHSYYPIHCPKVYIYNLSQTYNNNMESSSSSSSSKILLTKDFAFGKPYGMDGHLRDTHQYSFAQILLYRLQQLDHHYHHHSCLTNPKEAELFYVPIHPYIMGYTAWQEACDKMNVSKLVSELHYLTPQTSCRHFFVISKGHYVAYNCTGWWSNPIPLLQNSLRIAYSHVEYERKPNGGIQPFLKSIPNLFSVPYPSNVHWTGNNEENNNNNNVTTTTLIPPWTKGVVNRRNNHNTTMTTTTTTSPSGSPNLVTTMTTTSFAPILMSYIGSSSHGIDKVLRQRIKDVCQGYNNASICRTNKMVASRHESINIKKRSIFCLEPVGDSPWRKGIADSISFGCIPIFFSNVTDQVADWSWGHWKRQGRIILPRNEFVDGTIDLYTLFNTIPIPLLYLMQDTLAKYGRQFQYSLDDDPNDGIHRTLLGLWRQAEFMEQEEGKCQ